MGTKLVHGPPCKIHDPPCKLYGPPCKAHGPPCKAMVLPLSCTPLKGMLVSRKAWESPCQFSVDELGHL